MSFIQIGKSATGVFLPISADPRPTATIILCGLRESLPRDEKQSGKEPLGLDQKNPIELMQLMMRSEIEDWSGMGDNLSKCDQ